MSDKRSKVNKEIEKSLDTAVRTVANSKSSKKQRIISLVFIIAVLAIGSIIFLNDNGYLSLLNGLSSSGGVLVDGSSQVHFIDVGQGDCELIIADDGSAMLIDSGESEYGAKVVNYLNKLGVDRLDYLLVTHPHSDHMGGMAEVVSSDIEIGMIILPYIPDEYIPTTRVYERLINAIADKGYRIHRAATEEFEFGAGTIEIIATGYSGDNMNNYSPVVRYTFGEMSFIFSGDLESGMEREIVSDGYDISADVYKVAHHGSTTSSCSEWLRAIEPDYCVIECGEGNIYGHPHDETVEALREYTDVILRTDISGTIVFTTDGRTLTYAVEK